MDKIFEDVGRIKLINPNYYENQYGKTSDNMYNMSVPSEDLCISVELSTVAKNRTRISNEVLNISSNTDESVLVKFIGGVSDKTTDNQPYLTTSYTDLTTNLNNNSVDESLGITSIDISFDSSYTPMININFVDIRGAAIFQNEGNSKYGVLFKFPYPLFELKVKGYYGKPVTYCLHMTKCTSKFNSQTGNFEISSQFIGYTYALLSDMVIGYLKAAEETPAGKHLLETKYGNKVLSINKFIEKVSQIDNYVKTLTNPEKNDEIKSINGVPQLKNSLNEIISKINQTINDIDKINTVKKATNIDSLKTFIVILENYVDSNNTTTQNFLQIPQFTNSIDLNILITNFNTEIKNLIDSYNQQVVSFKFDNQFLFNEDLKLNITTLNSQSIKISDSSVNNIISNSYNLSSVNLLEINKIKTRLVNVSQNLSQNITVTYYDFNNLKNMAAELLDNLDIKNNILISSVSNKLTNNIQKDLGMPTDIRSIFKIFTTAAEIFLIQLVDVSKKASIDESKERANEFKRINTKNLDINSNTIYPWPEYSNEGIETYLGTTSLDHSKIPELNFVDELYTGMLISAKIAKDSSLLVDETNPLWYSVNPLDSSLNYIGFNTTNEKNPYNRLPSSANMDDIARLALLRGIAYMAFSNSYLSTDEITTFAKNEAKLISDKFSENENIIKGFNTMYKEPSSFLGITGIIDGKVTNVLTSDNTNVNYNYLVNQTNGEAIIPLMGSFTNISYNTIINNNDILNNAYGSQYGQVNANGNFITIIPKDVYETRGGKSESIIFEKLKNLDTIKKLTPQSFSDAKFLAPSGKYGIQEFITINYNGFYGQTLDSSIPFYTLFYSNSSFGDCNITALAENKTYKTVWDINTGNDPLITLPSFKEINDYSFNNEVFTKSGVNSMNKKNIGNNIELMITNTNLNYPCVNFGYIRSDEVAISLFGSRFYNAQTSIEARALLFLHTLPWRGLTYPSGNTGIFSDSSIRGIFKYRSGFIQVPQLFPKFLGGLLWRYKEKSDPIKYFLKINGEKDYLLPSLDNVPNKNQYLRNSRGKNHSMSFSNGGYNSNYVDIELELLNLPESVVKILIQEFLSFVNNDFRIIRQNFELVPYESNNYLTSDTSWVKTFDYLSKESSENTINLSKISNKLTFVKGDESFQGITFQNSFEMFTFCPNQKDANYYIRYKDGGQHSEFLKKLFLDYVYISNNSYIIWNFDSSSFTQTNTEIVGQTTLYNGLNFKQIKVSKDDFNNYFKGITLNISDKVKEIESTKSKIGDSTVNNIKFETYRNLKKIYEKWVTDLNKSYEGVVFQCCTKSKIKPDSLSSSEEMKVINQSDGLGLINTFRFIDRGFADIGNIFNINPFIINKMLLDNTNINLYNFFGKILDDNHFNFIALPNFIDYNDEKELKEVFNPIPYYKLNEITTTGPAFICVYVGQNSTKLDFGTKNEYPNDGFDIKKETIPPDLKTEKKAYEDVCPAFVVKYGQQNQNIFKDITLDQSEFSETIESLQITDNIANGTLQSALSFAGQNLFNIYSARSYKAEVEMLGNAMIQPMMYFQLDNIPMFHGAFLITKVKHSIKPNHMSTIFTGTRVKYNKTPLIDSATLYAEILSTYGVDTSNTTTSSVNNVSIPNTILISDLKGTINNTKFINALNNKFTHY